ncbi:YciI family protein [Geomicrobium sp. JCM 19055]|uniref:YciI family protein n=1 Tax=Geomicrobium sp. JCM 19055 TaxID=1460649 RepID=UPI00045EDDD2|nr:YciI family protein [Geomicrobium sp. JCM 19055]GAK00967.1 hypothetical protein JCM19055_4097 [Geomicrobium sp. JCM 19055]
MATYAVFLPLKDEEKSKEHRPAHLDYLERLHETGHVLARGPFVDGSGGLVIYESPSYDAVEKLVNEDPYVVHGARDYVIHEWALVGHLRTT